MLSIWLHLREDLKLQCSVEVRPSFLLMSWNRSQSVCFHFIHAFELILGKHTVFQLILNRFLLQTLSVGNNGMILQHLN